MGCCSSNIFHDEEKGLDDHLMPYLDYSQQTDDEYKQLDTENDQKGDTAVEHIFKKTKTVYGQPPKDMRNVEIDWKNDYDIDLRNRPCPYDFPAFEGDKPPDYDEKKKEEEKNKDKLAEKEDNLGRKAKSPSKGDGRRKKSSGLGRKKSDDDKAGGKRKRSSNNLDECSISDN